MSHPFSRANEQAPSLALLIDGRSKTSAMKVIDDEMYENEKAAYDYISWPAKTPMPTNYFSKMSPWSFSFNTARYDSKYMHEVDITVTLLTDNKTWHFNENKIDGFYATSEGGYGSVGYTIIFRPIGEENEYITYNHGDTYRVEMENVRLVNGSKETITFETTFFTLTDE